MLDSVWLQFFVVLFLLVVSGFFPLSEIAIISASKSKLFKLKSEGNRRATLLSKLREDKEGLIGAILLGNTFVNIAASTIATSLSMDVFGDNAEALALATVIMTVMILIYGEVLPKTYAVRNAEKSALFVTPFFIYMVVVFKPFVKTVQYIVNLTLRPFTKERKDFEFSGLDIIRGTVETQHAEGMVVSEDKYMIGGLIDLEKITVEEIMIHRSQIRSISIDKKPEQFIKFILSNKHSRIPVWQDDPANVVGILIQRDLSRLIKVKGNTITKTDIKKILRKPWFVPNLTNLKQQLKAFRENQTHFALVVDEYGELLGLVTLEDILEEVVGHIEDEYDAKSPKVIKKHDGNFVVALGDLSIRDLNREMHWNISDEHASTVGGLVFHLAKGIPAVGEKFKFEKFTFKVIKRHHNTITKVIIKQGNKAKK